MNPAIAIVGVVAAIMISLITAAYYSDKAHYEKKNAAISYCIKRDSMAVMSLDGNLYMCMKEGMLVNADR